MATVPAGNPGRHAAVTAYVAVVLDITCSMGNQIQGIKGTFRELCPLLNENPGLGILIVTFTENCK